MSTAKDKAFPYSRARLRWRRLTLDTQWFQQDGAVSHTATETRNMLSKMFEDRIISLKLPTFELHIRLILARWISLCGSVLKTVSVYQNNPGSIPELNSETKVFTRTLMVTHARH